MKLTKPIFAMAATAILLAGCAAPDTDDAPAAAEGNTATESEQATASPSASPTQSASTSASPSKAPKPSPLPTTKEGLSKAAGSGPVNFSERGAITKKVGVPGAAGNDNGDLTMIFRVNEIAVDPQCVASGTQAKNGRLVAIHMDVQTTKALAESDKYDANPYDWEYLKKNGSMMNGEILTSSARNCLPKNDMMPRVVGPARKASGYVVLDVANAEGVLIFGEDFVDKGWEYKLSK